MRIRVGCTSWSYPDWVGPFYPPGTPSTEFLQRYARAFELVEVDATFYRMPSPEVSARWASDTPEGFTLTAKLPRRITHDQRLVGVADALRAFLERIGPIRDAGKLGPLVAQFPATFTRAKGGAALEPFLELVPEHTRLAFEFRHDSWFVPETYDALRRHGAALVWALGPQGMRPPELTADFVYARLVGPDRAFEKFDRIRRDLRPRMEELRDALRKEGQGAKEAFLLCSNHFMGHGPSTAAMLCDVLGVPTPDLAAAARAAKQRNLADFG